MRLLSKPPDAYSPKNGGIAYWSNVRGKAGLIYDSFTLRDQAVVHTGPYVHADYFTVQWRYFLKFEVIEQLSKLDNNIWYIPRRNLLSVECHFYGAALLVFALIKALSNGEISVKTAKDYYLVLLPKITEEWSQWVGCELVPMTNTPIHDSLENYLQS